MNKVIARFVDGRVLKGATADFMPTKDVFHVSLASDPAGSEPIVVWTRDLKALFFVKDYAGDPQHEELKEFDPARPRQGRRIKTVFEMARS